MGSEYNDLMNRLNAFEPKLAAGTPGYEIWFAVLIDAERRHAAWLRYTRLRKRDGHERVMLWAAFYDAHHPEHHVSASEAFAAEAMRWDGQALTLVAETAAGMLTPDRLQGRLMTPRGPMAWDLSLKHQGEPLRYVPAWLENSGIAKTRANIPSPFGRAEGEISLGDKRFAFVDAGALMTHIWGSQVLPELYWVFVPGFEGDAAGWGLEIVAARPKPWLPMLSFAILHKGDHSLVSTVGEALSGRVEAAWPNLRLRCALGSLKLEVACCLDLEQTSRYIYTDPDGSRRWICHSDCGELNCRISEGESERLLVARGTAAVEFHGPRPWDKAHYLDPLQAAP